MASRVKEVDESHPEFIDGYLYYTRATGSNEFCAFYRRKFPDGPEEVEPIGMLSFSIMKAVVRPLRRSKRPFLHKFAFHGCIT